MKKIFLVLTSLFISSTSFANLSCPQAVATTDPNFCPSFTAVAICHCTDSGLPPSVCTDVNEIYKRMIDLFGSIERACKYQHDTDTQTCIDDWKCYREGGQDSKGGQCSSTGKACQ